MPEKNLENDKDIIMTRAGLKALEEELEYLKLTKRKEVAERIKAAIAFGDLSENFEYDEAKNEQGFLEGRILTIEATLRNARIVGEDELNTKVVNVGNKVRVHDMTFDEEDEFLIVGPSEADIVQNKMSNESPLGKALLGHGVGSVVDVEAPGGKYSVKILDIATT